MRSESDLFIQCVNNIEFYKRIFSFQWEDARLISELTGFFGVPDLVIACSKKTRTYNSLTRTFAFEFKLKNWKKALIQAFKYAAFAQYSYVVMDKKYVGPAKRRVEEFERANIGLVSVDEDGQIEVIYKPKLRKPYSNEMRKEFDEIISSQGIKLSLAV